MAGAEGLIRGAVDLAARVRIPPLLVGLTVVAWGTSSPELAVSLRAGWTGETGVALGNVVGSNIFNVAVILGLGAVMAPLRVQVQLLRLEAPVLATASLAVPLMLLDGAISRIEGGGLLAGLVVYTALTAWMQRRSSERDQGAFAPVAVQQDGSLAIACLLTAGGLVLLVVGADRMVAGAVALAQRAGVDPTIVGLTVVAAGTSLPELLATVVAARRGQADIAIGNVLGSNLFNLLGILGASSLLTPMVRADVAAGDLWLMTGLAFLLVLFLWSRLTVQRWEGGVLLASWAAYLAWRWP